MSRWRVLLPPWVLEMAGGMQPLRDSFERNAENDALPAGCIGFEIVGDSGVPETPAHVYTCLRFRS
jgi:hypothetical protein